MTPEEKTALRWDINHQVGQSLQQLRQHSRLTVEQAATRSTLTPARVQAYERGNLPHNIHNLATYTEAIGGRLAIIPEESPTDPHCQFIECE